MSPEPQPQFDDQSFMVSRAEYNRVVGELQAQTQARVAAEEALKDGTQTAIDEITRLHQESLQREASREAWSPRRTMLCRWQPPQRG